MLSYSTLVTVAILVSLVTSSASFSTFLAGPRQFPTRLEAEKLSAQQDGSRPDNHAAVKILGNSAAMAMAAILMATSPVYADEFGVETEAPTLFTGETTMICTKRGPLGACLKTERRTQENDNDKADQYFQTPSAFVKQKDDEARTAESTEGNALIARLRQQTEDNREKNELLVQQKTFLNDVSASFGPFDGQVLILNENGKGFTLLENPQAMRLKKAGFIQNKKFVQQPTQAEIDDALVAPENSGFFSGIFGN